uniref:Uncharacterized protein n=1 Tax=Oryza meridionalis TaxID=40149 RepID=A0A0E0DQX0_9ORYZ
MLQQNPRTKVITPRTRRGSQHRDGSRARRVRVVTTHTRAHEVIHVRGHTRYYITDKEHYLCPLPAGAMCPRACSRARRVRVVTTHTRAHEVIHVRGHTRYYITDKEHYLCPLPAGAMCPRACSFIRYKLTVQHFNHKSSQTEIHYHNLKKGYSCTKFINTRWWHLY